MQTNNNNPFNPDVLSCLANLSSDEVFTPPPVVNEMLDMLPQELFRDPNTTFLDPACKTGVFLREITKRLITGLEPVYPDLEERLQHIYEYQVFGVALTELTGLMSRRTLYCSKRANSDYSVLRFNRVNGNIMYDSKTKHTWVNGSCVICGASQEQYDREDVLESYAYDFIHRKDLEELLKMKFDVIIGNPPYQLSDSGQTIGTVGPSSPIYHLFIQQAKKLNPRYLSMIIPARWFTGGKGLDKFREEIITDHRVRKIVDYRNASDCFPCIELRGGVCYFLWDRDNPGDCEFTSLTGNSKSITIRPIVEDGLDVIIRHNETIPILRKIRAKNEISFRKYVSVQTPFGIYSTAKGKDKPFLNSIKMYGFKTISYINKNIITENTGWVNQWKIYISKAYGQDEIPSLVLNKPILGLPETCCTQTYLVIGPFISEEICRNVVSYINTRFFRFLVMQIKNTQNTSRKVYSLVPDQDFSRPWTDEDLYKKYGLTEGEIAFIESMVYPREEKAINRKEGPEEKDDDSIKDNNNG